MFPRGENWQDVAQVCLNGHALNDRTLANPDFNRPHCSRCGSPTITACPSCGTGIPGEYHVPGVAAIGFRYHAPAFCGQCGAAFPWTEARLTAARELSKEVEHLSPREREELAEALPDLIRDVPMTPVAATRFRRLLTKAGGPALGMFRELLVDVMSEAAKKIVFPQ